MSRSRSRRGIPPAAVWRDRPAVRKPVRDGFPRRAGFPRQRGGTARKPAAECRRRRLRGRNLHHGDGRGGRIGHGRYREHCRRGLVQGPTPAGQTCRIDLEGQSISLGTLRDPFICGIYDADGNKLSGTSNNYGGRDQNDQVSFAPETGGTYYIAAVSPIQNGVGTYRLSVTEIDTFATGRRSAKTSRSETSTTHRREISLPMKRRNGLRSNSRRTHATGSKWKAWTLPFSAERSPDLKLLASMTSAATKSTTLSVFAVTNSQYSTSNRRPKAPAMVGHRYRLAVNLDVLALVALGEVCHGRDGRRLGRHRRLSLHDSGDDRRGILAGQLGRELGIRAERHALRPPQGAGLGDEDLLAGRVDANAESGKIAIPEDGVLAVDGEALQEPFGKSAILGLRHGAVLLRQGSGGG